MTSNGKKLQKSAGGNTALDKESIVELMEQSYHENAKAKYFYDNIFEKGAIPIINRPTRISEHSASLIDNILTTDIFNNSLKKGIIKSDVSDHFPIFFSIRLTKEKLQEGPIKIKKKSFQQA